MPVTKKIQPAFCFLLALLQGCMVLALGLASVNPEIHEALHAGKTCPHHECGSSNGEESGDTSEPGAACPVVLFGQGFLLGLSLEMPTRGDFTQDSCALARITAHDLRTPLTQRSRAPPTVLFV